jgi:hypothetical protein
LLLSLPPLQLVCGCTVEQQQRLSERLVANARPLHAASPRAGSSGRVLIVHSERATLRHCANDLVHHSAALACLHE